MIAEKGFATCGSTDAFARREQLLETFEEAWRRGQRPAIDDYLPDGVGEPELLLDFVQADLEYRLKASEPARVEDYLGRFPELAGKPAFVLALIAREYQLRREEPSLCLAEYAARFPEYQAHLATYLSSASTSPRALFGEDEAGLAGDGPTQARHSWPSVPGFAILGVLGRGGMGVVYKARQAGLDRVVALKMVLGGAYAAADQLARFRREGAAIARLVHPHIVQIYEVGDQAGQPFYAMEYVPGGNLASKLAGTPQSPRAAAELVETLARTIQAAHEQGIVHRDLKPANILLAGAPDTLLGQCTPKISDFGLAKVAAAPPGAQEEEPAAGGGPSLGTPSGAIMGSPSYMAPEQAQAKSDVVGPAADIYALGAILYELLTGAAAVQGGDVAGDGTAGDSRGAGVATALAAEAAARPGDCLLEVLGQGAAETLRHGGGAGRRLGTLWPWGGDSGPARRRRGAAVEMGETPAGRRGITGGAGTGHHRGVPGPGQGEPPRKCRQPPRRGKAPRCARRQPPRRGESPRSTHRGEHPDVPR